MSLASTPDPSAYMATPEIRLDYSRPPIALSSKSASSMFSAMMQMLLASPSYGNETYKMTCTHMKNQTKQCMCEACLHKALLCVFKTDQPAMDVQIAFLALSKTISDKLDCSHSDEVYDYSTYLDLVMQPFKSTSVRWLQKETCSSCHMTLFEAPKITNGVYVEPEQLTGQAQANAGYAPISIKDYLSGIEEGSHTTMGDCLVKCRCGHTGHTVVRSQITNTPDLLIVVVNRLYQKKDFLFRSTSSVNYSRKIRLKKETYDLTGVVLHSGYNTNENYSSVVRVFDSGVDTWVFSDDYEMYPLPISSIKDPKELCMLAYTKKSILSKYAHTRAPTSIASKVSLAAQAGPLPGQKGYDRWKDTAYVKEKIMKLQYQQRIKTPVQRALTPEPIRTYSPILGHNNGLGDSGWRQPMNLSLADRLREMIREREVIRRSLMRPSTTSNCGEALASEYSHEASAKRQSRPEERKSWPGAGKSAKTRALSWATGRRNSADEQRKHSASKIRRGSGGLNRRKPSSFSETEPVGFCEKKSSSFSGKKTPSFRERKSSGSRERKPSSNRDRVYFSSGERKDSLTRGSETSNDKRKISSPKVNGTSNTGERSGWAEEEPEPPRKLVEKRSNPQLKVYRTRMLYPELARVKINEIKEPDDRRFTNRWHLHKTMLPGKSSAQRMESFRVARRAREELFSLPPGGLTNYGGVMFDKDPLYG